MKKGLLVLLLLLLLVPLLCQAKMPGYLKGNTGTLAGQVITEDGKPLPGGVVSFFNTEKGIPPLVVNMHRVPDMVGKMRPDGKFTVKLSPGSYYMGALVITDPGRGPGPPREGETFYYSRDDKGNLLELTLKAKEIKDAGRVIAALPDTFPAAKNLMTIEGRLLLEDGTPFTGGVVLVKTDMSKARPDFVSTRTKEDGKFSLKLPPNTEYFLLGRERTFGRPVPGTYVGTYGSTKSISQGGALPVGGMQPAQPISGVPQVEGLHLGPGEDVPIAVMGKTGETKSGYDIMMFKVPVPGEQREKLQGTLGLGDEVKEKMDKILPLEPTEK